MGGARKASNFSSIVTRLKGETRGKGAEKKVYGDDLVQMVLVTGIIYPKLTERSLAKLATLAPADVVEQLKAKGRLDKDGNVPTVKDVWDAIEELRESFTRSTEGTNESTTDHVYDPLVWEGETVRSGRVYKCVAGNPDHECHCRVCTGDERAPLPGTIYLKGLSVSRLVLDPAPNGPIPASKSGAKVVAKDYIKGLLPVSRFRTIPLEPGKEWSLHIGGAAIAEAEKNQIVIDEADLPEDDLIES